MFHVTRRRVGSASTGGSGGIGLGARSASTARQADAVTLPSQGSAYTRGNPVRVRLERGSVVHDWIPQDTVALEKLAWLIYLTDGVIGPALDFYREVPFGPVILSGVKDARRLRLYNDCLDALNIQRFLPFLSGDILVSGRGIIHMIMNERRGYWTEMISHMTQHVQIQPSPVLGQNPTIDLMVPPEYQRWAASTDPRVITQHESIDPELLGMLAAGRVIPLDPDSTIFVPRRASTNDNMGTTLLTRTFAIAALEWCVPGGTLVDTDRGLVPIAGLENVEGTKVATHKGVAKAARWRYTGIKPIQHVRTECGFDLRSSYRHPYWTVQPDLTLVCKDAEDLKPGDLVGVRLGGTWPETAVDLRLEAENAKKWCQSQVESGSLRCIRQDGRLPTEMTSDLARILGYLVAEGNSTRSDRIVFTNKNQEVLDDFLVSFSVCFPDYSICKCTSKTGVTNVYCTAVKLRRYLEELGLGQERSPHKEVPWSILQSTKEHVGAFLSAYFEGDGGSSHTTTVEASSTSSRLLRQVQILLAKLEVVSRVKPRARRTVTLPTGREFRSSNRMFRLRVSGNDQLQAFQKVVSFRSEAKNAAVAYIVDQSSHQRGSRISWAAIGHLVAEAVAASLDEKRLGYGRAGYKAPDGSRVEIATGHEWKRHVQRATDEQLEDLDRVDPVLARRIQDLQELPLFWDVIQETRREPAEPVYNIYVPEHESFVANGIAVHNCMMDAEATGLRRRASPLTIVTAGIENVWEASPEELQSIMELVMAAEEDPVHPTIALRNGIELHTESGWSELTKWIEQFDVLKNAKLQAIGMNEAFASGEASWSYLESMLSLGMERIRNFRRFIAQEIILEGILAPLARLHGFYKSPQNNADHRIRTATKIDANLDLPTVEWARSLQPTTDRDYLDILVMLQENGLPIPLRKWAQAGGYDIDEAVEGMNEDIALRKRLAHYKEQIEGVGAEPDISPEEPLEARVQRVRQVYRWRGGEFMGLKKPDVERHLSGVKLPLDQSGWHQLESRLRDSGVHDDQIRALEYGVARAGMLRKPLSREAIVCVRDELIRSRPLLSNTVAADIKFLNHAYGVHAAGKKGNGKLSFNIPPAGPKLLTGEGYSG